MADLARQALPMGSRPALILVDLSCGFTDPNSPLGCDCNDVIDVNARVLAAFRKRRVTNFLYDGLLSALITKRLCFANISLISIC